LQGEDPDQISGNPQEAQAAPSPFSAAGTLQGQEVKAPASKGDESPESSEPEGDEVEEEEASKGKDEKQEFQEDDEEEESDDDEVQVLELARRASSTTKEVPEKKQVQKGLPKKVPFSQMLTQDEAEEDQQSQASRKSGPKAVFTSPTSRPVKSLIPSQTPSPSPSFGSASATSSRKRKEPEEDVSLTPDTSHLASIMQKQKKMKGKKKFGKNVSEDAKRAAEEKKYQDGKIPS